MSRKRKTLNEKVTSWWREPRRAKKRIPSRKAGSDIEIALAELQEEQSRLSAELERAFLTYDRKTQALAKQLARWTEGGAEPKAIERLRREQEELWRTVRRTQAAGRTTRELEQELREWAGRDAASVRERHPDHPKVRSEIVASELRVRGRDPGGVKARHVASYEGSAKDVDPYVKILERDENEFEGTSTVQPSVAPVALEPTQDLSGSDEQDLVREIESCVRELKRALVHDEREALTDEIVMMLKDLRRFHELLRRADRKSGIRRYRFAIGDLIIR